MKTYTIYIDGQTIGKQELTPEEVKKYNAAGIICRKETPNT